MTYKPPTKLELRVILEEYLESPDGRTILAMIPNQYHRLIDPVFFAGMEAGKNLAFGKVNEMLDDEELAG